MFTISLTQKSQHLDTEKGKQDTAKSESDQMTQPRLCGGGEGPGIGVQAGLDSSISGERRPIFQWSNDLIPANRPAGHCVREPPMAPRYKFTTTQQGENSHYRNCLFFMYVRLCGVMERKRASELD